MQFPTNRSDPLRKRWSEAWKYDNAARKKIWGILLKYTGRSLAITLFPVVNLDIEEGFGKPLISDAFFPIAILATSFCCLICIGVGCAKIGKAIANHMSLVPQAAFPQAESPVQVSAAHASAAASAPKALICSTCGSAQPDGSLFCNQCGNPLSENVDVRGTKAVDPPSAMTFSMDDNEDFFVEY